ncbi:putative fatty-acid--CoA ligase [Caenibius tardaugens NBRC 16725]|uniref:Putative fatty-acid--CoA ligase n=1 Tax=Caenibius tardaugens NBRC 16725 TaxID=1219035 RepID=U2YNS3_9SPHN|nr:AMP-binding protein [Caenibius tardaugens]AZI35396.1 long-chain fatty acid--CoA ligase [Caenibius tardaugens NBRC 16725]GAD50515.1 putative fatty-acid--CoA ligase [Caenibius tardaugens NBRC 16725]
MIALHQRLAWLAQAYPNAPAIVDAGGTVTFAQAQTLADRMAAGLIRSGLKPGDRFLVLSANRRESLLAFVAASATGTVCTPLNTRLAPAELTEIASDARPTIALADADGAAKLAASQDHAGAFAIVGLDGGPDDAGSFDKWVAEGLSEECTDAVPDFQADPQTPLFQLYTSGTTGRPSGIVIAQGAWSAQIEQYRMSQPYGPGDGVLVVTPLFHIAAAITAIAALVSGARIELPDRFDAEQVLDVFIEGSIAGTMMVPAMIDSIVAAAARRGLDRIAGVRRICYGASPITEGLLRNALDLFGCDFIQGYGLTETAGVATILMPADHRLALAGRAELLRSAGRPVMGAEIRIALEDGRIAAAGAIGEIQISGPNLFSGYYNNAERTASAWTADGWFRSGDAGYCDADGYVFVIDRIKDLVITGGENVFPQEVERVIATHPAVAEVVVYGVPDARWGEAVSAALVLKDGQRFDETAMRAFVDHRLARFKTPRHYRVLPELPRNATGKVLRRELAGTHHAEDGPH